MLEIQDLAYQVKKVRGIRYLLTSPRSGRPLIVLVHGLGESLDHWLPVIAELRKDYQVLAFDIPGCGDSDRLPKLTRSTMTEQLLGLIESVADSDKYILVAHSLGVIAACDLAPRLSSRLRALVLVDASMYMASEALHFRIANVGISFTVRIWRLVLAAHIPFSERLAIAVARSSLLRRIALSHVLWRPERVPAATLATILRYTGRTHGLAMLLIALRSNYLDLLRQVACEVQVVFGDHDWLISDEDLTKTSEAAQVTAVSRVRDCGHWSIGEKPSDIAAFIQESARRT